MENVPIGLEKFSSCKVFHRDQMESMKPEETKIETIGGVKIDEEEKSVLTLNPKFAIMKRIETIEMEQEVEVCLGKLRYESRKIMELIRELEIEETEYGIGSQCKERYI